MKKKLPPMRALYAFEAAARNVSFTKAAEELYITQTAVSHQIKQLEGYLGVELFTREKRRVTLTSEGADLYESVHHGLRIIQASLHRLDSQHKHKTLNLSLTPSFSAKWLTPRFPRYFEQYPDVKLHFHHSNNLQSLSGDMDLMIQYGRSGDWPGYSFELLFHDELIPVCSRQLIADVGGLNSLDDLNKVTLLHEDDTSAWNQWLNNAGTSSVDMSRAIHIDDSNSLMLAVENGLGVALGRTCLICHDVANGRLITPFRKRMYTGNGYYLLSSDSAIITPQMRHFREFLFQERQQTIELMETLFGSRPY